MYSSVSDCIIGFACFSDHMQAKGASLNVYIAPF